MLGCFAATCFALAGTEPFQPYWHQLERRQGAQLEQLALQNDDPLVLFATRAIAPERNFRELLVSWNADCPAGSGFFVELCVHGKHGDSPWLYLGSWGELPPCEKTTRFEHGLVDIDWFHGTDASFESAQVRLRRAEGSSASKLVQLSLCFSDMHQPSDRPLELEPPKVSAPAFALAVPTRSQKLEDPSIQSRVCSPTSVSMVLAYLGIERKVSEVAARCFDAEHDIYGNWPRNVQAAYSLGASGYLERFTDWNAVESTVRAGTPLVCSISVKAGELKGAPYTQTSGHLIVLVGFDEHGNCLVNDPASAEAGTVRRSYSRAELETVWMKKGGVAYVLSSRTAQR